MKTNLQSLRKEAGFKSARAFADHIGISPGTYTDYEQGRRDFALERAWEFADALGEAMGRYVSLDEIAGRDFPALLAQATGLDPSELDLIGLYRDSDARGKASIMAVANVQPGMEGPSKTDVSTPGNTAASTGS